MYVVISNNGTSMCKSQLHSMLKIFSISQCLLYQLWRVFQTKVYKIGGYYSARMIKNEKLVLYANSVNSISLRS
jgi:hypothetical protein